MAFPVTHFLLRINWTTRALETLPFHPVSLPFITGGASVLLSCIFVSAGNFGSAYLFFTCANMSYIVLFICRNADPERILNASYLAKVPDVWEVRWSLFTILFLFFQYTLTTTLRIVGRREADLGSFARSRTALSMHWVSLSLEYSVFSIPLQGDQCMQNAIIVAMPSLAPATAVAVHRRVIGPRPTKELSTDVLAKRLLEPGIPEEGKRRKELKAYKDDSEILSKRREMKPFRVEAAIWVGVDLVEAMAVDDFEFADVI
ncbi:hypothetical protein M413DRAFT_29855 [Hebeloma cylindrosporum]|uniref:Uncharacterized protein n=1 Tax=Hebeloma cylindrosporum TaxID=76867 RepID=A0A0C2YD26_HEBCY|nr:hypothetical protein M413DRAFT_29855 [Hebeloma cylindrosporum h7]